MFSCEFCEISKNSFYRTPLVAASVRLWFKNGCLKMKIHTSELLYLSEESVNSIVEDIIDLLQDIKSNLSSPYISVFLKLRLH